MKKINLKDILNPTISLFLVCLIVTLLLTCTNILTKTSIYNQKIKNDELSKKAVLPTAISFNEKSYLDKTYSVGINDDGTVAGYVFNTQAKGYGGTIEVMTGIAADSKVSGVTIISHNETPGLGANIKNNSFTDQFCISTPQDGFIIKKGNATQDNEINAITGATISSTAVNNAVNEALNLYEKIISDGGNINE